MTSEIPGAGGQGQAAGGAPCTGPGPSSDAPCSGTAGRVRPHAASTCRAPEVALHHTGEGQDRVREGTRQGAGEAALLLAPAGTPRVPTGSVPVVPLGHTLRGRAPGPPRAQGALGGCCRQGQACPSWPRCYRKLWAFPGRNLLSGQGVSSPSWGVHLEEGHGTGRFLPSGQ